MAGHATQQIDASTLWGGKVSPFSTSYGKLMIVLKERVSFLLGCIV
jgi:hypothetical protein